MNRRLFLGAAAASAAFAGTPVTPPSMTVAATGDCIFTRPVSALKHPQFLKMVELLRAADCLYGNCEMVLADHNGGGYPMYEGASLSVVSETKMATELAWMGFDIMGAANNHTWDYGQPGIVSTRAALKRAGIGVAGTGLDLQQAAAPAYADTPGGRVALINCASTFRDYAVAYPSRPDFKGIPGLNPVRLHHRFELDREAFEAITKTAEALRTVGPVGGGADPNPQIAADKVTLFGNTFVPSAATGVTSEVFAEDVARITASIKEARRNARLVLVSIHAHEVDKTGDAPAAFLQPFARACVDAGADAFFGAGSHVTAGIEFYKGRPICYGLGDFFFQYQTVPGFAADVFMGMGIDGQTPDPAEASDRIKLPNSANLWQTVVPVITYRNAGATAMTLHPVTLGMEEPRYQRGTPRLAEGTEAAEIIDRVARLSKPYGTSIQFRNGTGEVSIP